MRLATPRPVEKLRILLCDDHPIVRAGLVALLNLQDDMTVVGEASDGEAAIAAAASLKPDVVVLDISMPKMGGAEAAVQIKKVAPDVSVLALTAHEDQSSVQMLLRAGASGYLLKRSAAEDLVRAIHAVARGGTYVDPAMAEDLVSNLRGARSNRENGAKVALSEREAEVLRYIAEGHAMKEIASRLNLSTRTLETYKARAMEKLGVEGRAEIVRYALQRGWLRPM